MDDGAALLKRHDTVATRRLSPGSFTTSTAESWTCPVSFGTQYGLAYIPESTDCPSTFVHGEYPFDDFIQF